MNTEQLKKQLATWIDPYVIAETLVDIMTEEGEPEQLTLTNAKEIYLNFLETELSDGLKNSTRQKLTGSWRGTPPVQTKDYPRYKPPMTKRH